MGKYVPYLEVEDRSADSDHKGKKTRRYPQTLCSENKRGMRTAERWHTI